MKNKILGIIAAIGLCAFTVGAQNAAPFTFTSVPYFATSNAPGTTQTNVTAANIQYCPVKGSPQGGGLASPMGIGIWPAIGTNAVSQTAFTNTYYFVNVPNTNSAQANGLTWATTNTWSVTLACSGTTNANMGYTYVSGTNFVGAQAFALLYVATTATNTCLNTNLLVTYQY